MRIVSNPDQCRPTLAVKSYHFRSDYVTTNESCCTLAYRCLRSCHACRRPPGSRPRNTLTDAEKKAGWTLLFDGKTLDGWRGYKKPDATGTRWKVEDGC